MYKILKPFEKGLFTGVVPNLTDFVPVTGFEDYFAINRQGDVWSFRTKRVLKTRVTPSGYLTFATRFGGRNGTPRLFFVHRFVAVGFVSNPDVANKTQVNHLDGNKLNNSVDNLEWVTPSENVQHAYNTGLATSRKGENHPHVKITEKDVLKIRSLYIPRKFGKRRIARLLDLPLDAVGHVLAKNGNWQHVISPQL